MEAKMVAAAGVVLLSIGVCAGTLWAYPRSASLAHEDSTKQLEASAKRYDEFQKTKASALADHQKCVDSAFSGYRKRWSEACDAQAKKEQRDCRIDAVCVRGTVVEATDMCVLRDNEAKIDRSKVETNCAALHPVDPDCTLHERGPSLNAALERDRADCRGAFDLRMFGLSGGDGR
jgi:hypothetical protein